MTFAVGRVVDPRLGRPVVRVRVAVPRSFRRSRPGRPGEERGHLAELGRVRDRARPEPVLGRGVGEVVAVVRDELAEGSGLGGAERQRLRGRVVAVRAHVLDRPARRGGGRCAAVGVANQIGRPAQVVRGEVGPEVRAVAEDRAELHQPVVEEHLLALADVVPGEEDGAALVDDARRHRRVRHVRPVGEQSEDEEPAEDDEDHRLDPDLRDQKRTPRCAFHHSSWDWTAR